METFSQQPNCSRRHFLAATAAFTAATIPRADAWGEAADASNPKLARSSRGIVTSPHSLASEAGREVLAEGGNAIEAAIAMGSVLCVTYPHFCGVGGDAFLVVADRNGGVRTLSGIGQAATKPPSYADQIPVRGPGSALTAAATVDTWGRAYELSRKEWAGKRSWKSLFDRAIGYAANGFPVTPSQRFWNEFRVSEAKDWPGFGAAFMPRGKIPEVGDPFYQPQLARTLKQIADGGPREFYEGRLAARIAEGLQKAGSPLTAADLARCRARSEMPLRVAYRDGELVGLRPPTQGVTTLEIMGILDRFDLRSILEGGADYYHLLVEAVKQAFIDRNRYVADPEFVEVPTDRLLSKKNLDDHAKRIAMGIALPWPHVFKPGDTVYLAAVDRDGRCVSMLQTIYFDFGSGVMVGDTGILWHNRGAAFSLDPKHPNALRPGKRPFHTLNPGMYLSGGRPRLLYGTQGADGQPQTLAAVLTRLIDYGMDPLTALARPRFLLGKTFSDTRDTLKLEQDAGTTVFKELAARGHEMSPIPARSPLAGHPGAIRIEADGSLLGAHDPRSDGLALGL